MTFIPYITEMRQNFHVKNEIMELLIVSLLLIDV